MYCTVQSVDGIIRMKLDLPFIEMMKGNLCTIYETSVNKLSLHVESTEILAIYYSVSFL